MGCHRLNNCSAILTSSFAQPFQMTEASNHKMKIDALIAQTSNSSQPSKPRCRPCGVKANTKHSKPKIYTQAKMQNQETSRQHPPVFKILAYCSDQSQYCCSQYCATSHSSRPSRSSSLHRTAQRFHTGLHFHSNHSSSRVQDSHLPSIRTCRRRTTSASSAASSIVVRPSLP